MQILAENKISEEVLKQLWLQRLPIHMYQILSISKDKLSDLSQIADTICEVSGT